MDKKLKSRWLKALRSGKYTQARDRLWDKKIEAYCCIGVLCKIQGASDRFLTRKATTVDIGKKYGAGLSAWDFQPLAKMNDAGKSFVEIAKEIEADL